MSIYLDPEQTKRHEPLMTYCAEFIINHQGITIPVEYLVTRFLGKFTKGKDTKVRQALEEYTNDTLFDKIIISNHDGYIHPIEGKQDYLIDDYLRTTDKTAKSIFFRRGNNIKRLRNNGQCKEILGKYDSPIYETFLNKVWETDEERPADFQKPPVFNPADELDDSLVIPTVIGQQVGMRL